MIIYRYFSGYFLKKYKPSTRLSLQKINFKMQVLVLNTAFYKSRAYTFKLEKGQTRYHSLNFITL